MTKLEYLDLSDNQILYISQKGVSLFNQIRAQNLTINLVGNLFQCTCASMIFMKWLVHNNVHTIHTGIINYECQSQKYENPTDALLVLVKIFADNSGLVIVLSFSVTGFVIFVISIIFFKISLETKILVLNSKTTLQYW